MAKKSTEYDLLKGAVIGLYGFILDRHPNDRILHDKAQKLAEYSARIGILSGHYPDLTDKLLKDIRNEREKRK